MYALLAFFVGAALLVIDIIMQRRIDRREAEQFEADAKNYTRRKPVWDDQRTR